MQQNGADLNSAEWTDHKGPSPTLVSTLIKESYREDRLGIISEQAKPVTHEDSELRSFKLNLGSQNKGAQITPETGLQTASALKRAQTNRTP